MAVTVLPLLVPSKGGRSKQRHQRARMHHPGGISRGKELGVLRHSTEFGLAKGGTGREFFVDGDSANESQQLGEVPKEHDAAAGGDPMPLRARTQASHGPYGAQAAILELFGSAPVAFHRPLVELTGSVTAALWLSNALDLVRVDPSNRSDSFEMSKEECERHTGLTRREQETARLKLRELGIISEQRTRSRILFTLNSATLTRLLYDIANRKWQELQGARRSASGDTGTHG